MAYYQYMPKIFHDLHKNISVQGQKISVVTSLKESIFLRISLFLLQNIF